MRKSQYFISSILNLSSPSIETPEFFTKSILVTPHDQILVLMPNKVTEIELSFFVTSSVS